MKTLKSKQNFCEDSEVQAEISSIRMDDAPDGLINCFEAAVAFLLPIDQVSSKRRQKKRKDNKNKGK